jgi:hypothetical protein
MAIEQEITVGETGVRDLSGINRSDFTPPTIPTPIGTGWRLVAVSQTDISIYYFWERGTGFSTETSNFSVTDPDETFLVDASNGAVTATLPAVPRDGDTITIKKIDSSTNNVIINGNGNNIDGQSIQTITSQYDAFTLGFDTGQWFIL